MESDQAAVVPDGGEFTLPVERWPGPPDAIWPKERVPLPSEQPAPTFVIDNGSWECRAGWSISEGDQPHMRFRPLVVRPSTLVPPVVGNSLLPGHLSNASLKTHFDGSLVQHIATQERIFDHIFSTLGLDGEESVQYPLVLTETLCNAVHSRRHVTELVFEGYGVPEFALVTDSTMSLLANQPSTAGARLPDAALLYSISNRHTTILPILGGSTQPWASLRLPLGGEQLGLYLQNLLHIRAPHQKAPLSSDVCAQIFEKYCYCSPLTGLAELEEWKDHQSPHWARRSLLFQLHSGPVTPAELEAERLQRRKAAVDRGKALIEGQRKQLLTRLEGEARRLADLQAKRGQMPTSAWLELVESEFSEGMTESDFDEMVQDVADRMERTRARLEGRPIPQHLIDSDKPKKKELVEPPTDLLAIPDAELTPEALKKKRNQAVQHGLWRAHVKAREEKIAKEEAQRRAEAEMQDKLDKDPEGFAVLARRRWKAVQDRREDRLKYEREKGRRGTDAGRKRLKLLAHAARQKDSKAQKVGGGVGEEEEEEEEGFGDSAQDWAVYRAMAKGTGKSASAQQDSDEEQEEMAEVEAMWEQLVEKYPDVAAREPLKGRRKPLPGLHPLLQPQWGGPAPAGQQDEITPPQIGSILKVLPVGVERMLPMEALFYPSLMGSRYMGLTGLTQRVLSYFTPQQQEQMASCVFVAGAGGGTPGLVERLQAEVRALVPPTAVVNVWRGEQPTIDAYRGAHRWARDDEARKAGSWTRAEYDERGAEWFKENGLGNWMVERVKDADGEK